MILLLLACAGVAAPIETRPAPVLYGFWGLNGLLTPAGLTRLHTQVGMTVIQTASTDPAWTVGTLLPMARAAGVHVTLRLTGDHERYTRDGDFDLAAWKAQLARWEGADLAPFIADGTFAGHMLLDDITNFEGHDPTGAELEEMARASKALLPGLMTYVRQKASLLPDRRYEALDAAVNQYKAGEGDVVAYARDEAAAAQARGLGVINGLNIANGGDGSSGQPGWAAGRYAMSAAEIRTYGAVLASVPTCGMMLLWEYDAEERWSDGSTGAAYLGRPEVEAALAELGHTVAAHPDVGLLKR